MKLSSNHDIIGHLLRSALYCGVSRPKRKKSRVRVQPDGRISTKKV